MFEKLETTLNEIKRDADGACYKASKANTALVEVKQWFIILIVALVIQIFFLAHVWMSNRSVKQGLEKLEQTIQEKK